MLYGTCISQKLMLLIQHLKIIIKKFFKWLSINKNVSSVVKMLNQKNQNQNSLKHVSNVNYKWFFMRFLFFIFIM